MKTNVVSRSSIIIRGCPGISVAGWSSAHQRLSDECARRGIRKSYAVNAIIWACIENDFELAREILLENGQVSDRYLAGLSVDTRKQWRRHFCESTDPRVISIGDAYVQEKEGVRALAIFSRKIGLFAIDVIPILVYEIIESPVLGEIIDDYTKHRSNRG